MLQIGQVPTQMCTAETNRVSYIHGTFDVSATLTADQLLLLPLLTTVIDKMGTKENDFRTFDKICTANTAGLQFSVHIANNMSDMSRYQIGLSFASYCLEPQIGRMFDIVAELVHSFNFNDANRFDMLMKNYSSSLSVGIANSGHHYAMQGAAGLVSEAARLKARLGGIEHIEYIRELLQRHSPAELMHELAALARTIFTRGTFKCALNTSEPVYQRLLNEYERFVGILAASPMPTVGDPFWLTSKLLPASNVHTVMNVPVNYCAKSVPAAPFVHADFAALRVLGKVLTSKYLLPTVREQSGAYGAGASISRDGLFSFYSYRDPNTVITLDAFDGSAQWIQDNWSKIDEQLLFESKLGVLQQIDAPTSPGAMGLEYFLQGIDRKMHEEHRRGVLQVSREDLGRVTNTYLKEGAAKTVGRFVLGPANEKLKAADRWSVKEF